MTDYLPQLQQEIKQLLPDLEVESSATKIEIFNFGLKDLKVELDNRIIFRFYKIKDLKPQDVGLYLQTKMNFERISRKYIKEDSFYLYPNDSFKSDSKGSFEKRMWALRILKNAHEILIQLKDELKLEKKD